MKITFPLLGNSYFAGKAILNDLGIECIVPPMSSKSALIIGTKFSPEEICLPFKIILGNYIESIKMGADTIVLTGSCGPCRYGEYCELQMNIMKKLGYKVKFIVLDKPSSIGNKEFMRRINIISEKSSKTTKEKLSALLNGYKIINLIDTIEKRARLLAGYEINKGELKTLLNNCKNDSIKCNSSYEMLNVMKKYNKKIDEVKLDKYKNPIKIQIIGEIYTILEPFANLYVEDKLMDLGVSTRKSLTPSWWFKDAVLSAIKLNSLKLRTVSREYLPYYIGGHGRECIGEALMAYKEGFNGAIQIFPMGCMPEIVSKSILPSIAKDKNFPIMTLVMDEMTGESGYDTRIEAFVDLLERRNKNVQYGN